MDIRDDAQTLWTIQLTAGQVASMDLTAFRLVGGKQWYSDAFFTRNGERVRISYLVGVKFPHVHVVNRYVDGECMMEVDVNENLPQLQSFGFIE